MITLLVSQLVRPAKLNFAALGTEEDLVEGSKEREGYRASLVLALRILSAAAYRDISPVEVVSEPVRLAAGSIEPGCSANCQGTS